MQGVDGMTAVHPSTIEAWRSNPGAWREQRVLDGLVFEWEGGDLVVMTIEFVELLNRTGFWGRLPWVFERLGVVPGLASIMYRKVGVREL